MNDSAIVADVRIRDKDPGSLVTFTTAVWIIALSSDTTASPQPFYTSQPTLICNKC